MSRELRPGEHVFTTCGLAISQDPEPEVLLLAHQKLGFWLPPGGKIEWNETPIQALVREFDEEVGIDIGPYLPPSEPIDHVTVLPLPCYLTDIRVPAGKTHPDHPEYHFTDLVYVFRMPRLPVRRDVCAHWISESRLGSYPTPENMRRFIREQMRRFRA